MAEAAACRCTEPDCPNFMFGFPWCRPCGEHHRAPECAVDGEGRSLAPCGHPWDQPDGSAHICGEDDDGETEEFCSGCFAGMESSEHHERCVALREAPGASVAQRLLRRT